MAVTAVLRSQIWIPHHNRLHRGNGIPELDADIARSGRRKPNPIVDFESIASDQTIVNKILSECAAVGPSFPAKNIAMGKVKILKRGERLPCIFDGQLIKLGHGKAGAFSVPRDGGEEMVLCSTDWLGPDPETVQKQIRMSDLSSFKASPPPSSLPMPDFFVKREKKNDKATIDLRKLLRLDFA